MMWPGLEIQHQFKHVKKHVAPFLKLSLQKSLDYILPWVSNFLNRVLFYFLEEDTYCSVGEFNIEAIPEEYVPFEALESKEDHTYSVPDPFKPVSPPDQDVYDALACTS